MINTGVNAIKDLQVGLSESRLYDAKIDGVWGGGSLRAVETLFGHAAKSRGVTVPGGLFATPTPDALLKDLQTALKAFGLYTGRIDGIYGIGSSFGFYTLNKEYRISQGLPEYDICWSNRVPTAFTQRVKQWADDGGLGWQGAHCCMAVMGFESAGTFDPAIQNMAGAQAYGLIQFMKGAAADLRTTLDALRQMTQMEQLEYVFKYLDNRQRQYGKFKRLDDFYLSIFYPKAIGYSPNEKIFLKGSKGYTQNRGLDINKDDIITVGEISSKIYESYFEGMLLRNRKIKS